MRNRDVGRSVAARGRVPLLCEPLEGRETPTATVLDPAFGTGGRVFETRPGAPGVFTEVAVQADGKILAAGVNSNHAFVARYHKDGTPDSGFGKNGIASFDFDAAAGQVDSIAVQPNGKILVAGSAATSATAHRPTFELARLNTDGSLDKTFGGDGLVTASFGGGDSKFDARNTDVGLPTAVTVQSDGKIVVVGSTPVPHSGSSDDISIAVDRFNSDGTLDTGFNHTGKVVTTWSPYRALAEAVVVQSDGKIDVAGTLLPNSSTQGPGFFVARYNKDGTPDATFHKGDGKVASFGHSGSAAAATSIALQKDGKILVAGELDSVFAVERFTADGQVDTTFGGGDGVAGTSLSGGTAHGVAVQSDGKLVVGGTAFNASSHHAFFALARFTADGRLDTTLDGDGLAGDGLGRSAAAADAFAIQADGNVVLGGSAAGTGSSTVAALARFSLAGTVTPTDTSSSIKLTASATSPTVGQSVTLTATVTASGIATKPGGTVTFKDGTTTLGTATLVDGSASFSWSKPGTGSHTLTAVYGGGGAVSGSTSAAVTVTVNKWKLQLSAPSSSSAGPIAGTGFSLYASFDIPSGTTASPGGTVTFKDGNTVLGSVSINPHGRTELSGVSLSAGTHSITAVYSGDANYLGTTSAALSLTVAPNKVTPQLAAPSFSNAHPPAGTPVTLSVSFTLPSGTRATPGGTVTFKDGSTFLGTVDLNTRGATTLSVSNLAAGKHQIIAAYSGDGHFNAVTSSSSLTVDPPAPVKTAVKLSTPQVSDSRPTQGSSVTFGVSFSLGSTSAFTPTGNVTFKDGNTVLGTVPLNAHGPTQFSYSQLALGNHSITAVYSGDSHFLGATSAATSLTVVSPLPPGQSSVHVSITTLGTIQADMPIVFQIIVTSPGGTPNGWLSVTEGTHVWGRVQLDNHGKAALAIGIGMPQGTHTIAAYYDGNASFASGASTTTFTLEPAQFR